MFELSLFVGLGAIVVCFLKGRWAEGLAAAAIGAALVGVLIVRGDTSAGDISALTLAVINVGFPAFAIVAALLAWPSAKPDTYWDRRSAADADGILLLDKERPSRRVGRMVLGAFLGLVPALVFMFSVFLTLEGDSAQIGFLGLPVGLFGMLFGGWIGYNWLPRTAPAETEREPELVH
jgi:hypothetical protein